MVMVRKNHHFFLFFDTIFGTLSSIIQQILEAPQKNAEAPQQILEPPKFRKEPVFQQNAAVFCQKKCQKIGVMVFLNHHYKPSLFNLLYFRMLKAKVMDCGLFSNFE